MLAPRARAVTPDKVPRAWLGRFSPWLGLALFLHILVGTLVAHRMATQMTSEWSRRLQVTRIGARSVEGLEKRDEITLLEVGQAERLNFARA